MGFILESLYKNCLSLYLSMQVSTRNETFLGLVLLLHRGCVQPVSGPSPGNIWKGVFFNYNFFSNKTEEYK